MPGLLAPIKYWQLDNEADLHYKHRGSGDFDNPNECFQVLRMTYEELKIADPEVRLMINLAGLGKGIDIANQYLQDLIDLSALNYFDILSYHVYPTSYKFTEVMNFFNTMQILVGEKPVWIKETAVTSKGVNGFEDSLIANEANQAIWLIKNFLYHAASGVRKVLWLNHEDFTPSVNNLLKYGGLMTFHII
ncbi:MAG: glycosyl hydrolase [bacterium]